MPIARRVYGAVLFTAVIAWPGLAGACTVGVAGLSFGTYDNRNDGTGTARIGVDCASGVPYEVLFSAGAATYADRRMSNGSGGTLSYNIYTSASYAQIWGDGIASGTASVSGAGTGLEQALTAFGRLPASQNPPAGGYSDTIVVTVSF